MPMPRCRIPILIAAGFLSRLPRYKPGCTVKDHKDRYVPLHPEIVKRLIPYREKVIAEHGHGPLFRHVRPDKNGRRTTYVARKIDDWMDDVIKDPNLAPNHSFRHYLKSQLLD